EIVVTDCADRDRQQSATPAGARRSARRECVLDWRCFRPCRGVQHCLGFGVVLPDAVEWRSVRAPADSATRHHHPIYSAAAALRRGAHAGLGGAEWEQLERTLLLVAKLRPHRIYRHQHLDRSLPAAFRGVADEPRSPDAREPEDSTAPPRIS